MCDVHNSSRLTLHSSGGRQIVKRLASCVLLGCLVGCAATATPSLIGDHYYMMGDANCVSGQFVSDTRMMCVDRNGTPTGYRDGMSANELAYQQQAAQVQHQQSMQALNQSLQSFNQQMQQQTQQIMQQSQQYAAPQVAPITPPGGNRTLCLVNGQYIACRSN